MGMDNVLIVYRDKEFDRVKSVTSVLEKKKIKYKTVDREKLTTISNVDLIISFGGDGTFLKTASAVMDSTPILGVDSNPGTRVGFYTRANINNFKEKLGKKFRFVSLQRLRACINGKFIPKLALNEFLITTQEPYHTANYELEGEKQQSSGILIGTGSGSTAWIKSAGGKKLPMGSKKFQYVVR